jgi:hypothetical protein
MSVQVTTEQGVSQTYNYTLYRQSGDAIISSTNINNQMLTFDGTDSASITLSNGTPVSSLVLNATAHDSKATLSYSLNGSSASVLTSNTDKTITGLVAGDNTLTITDTAEDANVFKTYTITIHNVSNNADLNTLTADYSDYPQVNLISTSTHTIGSGLGASVDVTIIAAVAESHATVSIDGVAGSTKTISVAAGTTRNVAVVVTAGNGTTTRTYNVSFTMPAVSAISNNDTSLITLGYTNDLYVQLNPNSASQTTELVDATQIYISAITNDTNASASLIINGINQTLESPIPITYGTTTATVVVTAEDGTVKIYTLTFNNNNSIDVKECYFLLPNGDKIFGYPTYQYNSYLINFSGVDSATNKVLVVTTFGGNTNIDVLVDLSLYDVNNLYYLGSQTSSFSGIGSVSGNVPDGFVSDLIIDINTTNNNNSKWFTVSFF